MNLKDDIDYFPFVQSYGVAALEAHLVESPLDRKNYNLEGEKMNCSTKLLVLNF